MKAASLTGTKFYTVNLQYQSVDAGNQPVTLSAVLYYPTSTNGTASYKTIKYIFLNNHATITDDASSPSGGGSPMGQVSYMTSEDALVVCPDYLGFGETSSAIHPYMCQRLTARNVVDCLKAAIADARTRTTLASDYYTVNCGYSQGGGVAMAVQRYLETEADEDTQRLINLRGSICGAGCYNQSQIFDDYEKREAITYPIYLPYTIQAMKQIYADGCMKDIALEECFTPAFWNSGILQLLNDKDTDVDALNAKLIAVFGGTCSFYDIMAAEYRDRSSRMYRAIHKALEKNDLTEGWTPQHPIVFYHYTQDEVVPYAGAERAMELWSGTGMVTLKKAESITNYGAWQLAFLKYPNLGKNHRDYGTCFYLAVFDGQLTPARSADGYTGTLARPALHATLTLVGDKAYATLYTPYDVQIPQGVRAYTAHLVGDKMHLVELAGGIIPAFTGVVLRGDAGGEKTLTYASPDEYYVESDLDGTLADRENTGDVLSLGTNASGLLGFYQYTGPTLMAGKAYFQLPAQASMANGYHLSFDQEDGISKTDMQAMPEDWYGIDGRKFCNPIRGINIIRQADGTIRKAVMK